MEKLDILNKLSFYERANSNFKVELENQSIYLSLPKGKILFLEGDGCQNVGFVGEGNIRVSKIGGTGREVTLYHVYPGEGCVLNISCAFADLGYPATATIETPTEMIIFPAVIFREWMSRPAGEQL